MSTRDEVTLSPHERQLLGRLEARARTDDPGLAVRLRGRPGTGLFDVWRRCRAAGLGASVGPLVLLAGLVVTVVAVTSVVWLSILGVALCVVGGCGIGFSVREWVNARRPPTAD